MVILNLSKAPQVTKTGIEGAQNQRKSLYIASCQRLIKKKKQMEIQKVRQQMCSTGEMYEKVPLHGNLALYRNDRQMHRRGAGVLSQQPIFQCYL